MFCAGAHRGNPGFLTGIRNFWLDRRGVAAIEFAFIAPVLLIMYFLTMEVSQAIETSKKVGRIGSMVADLVTQQQAVTLDDLDAIMKIGESTLQPYNRSAPTIIITGIEVSNDAEANATVAWSRKMVDGAYSADADQGSPITLPDTLKVPGTFLVRVESKLGYTPVITWTASEKKATGLMAAFDNISMGETYYLRPRMTQAIACTGC